MTPYIIISLILFLFSVLETNLLVTRKQKRIISSVIFFSLTLLQILKKDTVGSDLPIYTNFFNLAKVEGLGFGVGYESGFVAINKLFLLVSDNVHIFYSLIYFFINYAIYKFIERYSTNKSFSWLLFIWFGYWGQSFYVLRQYLALATIIHAVLFYLENKKIFATILFVLAFSFHNTAVMLIAVIIGYKYIIKYVGKRYDYLFLLITLIISVFASNVILTQLVAFFPKYNRYLDNSGDGKFMMLVLISVFLFYKLCYKKEINSSFFIYTSLVSIFLQGFALNMDIFQRIIVYVSVVNIVGIPNALMSNKKIFDRFVIHNIISITMFSYYIYIMKGSSIVPLIYFWQ